MTEMATLYIRDVPEALVNRLKRRARREGRSLNSEVLMVLGEAARQERTLEEVLASIDAFAKRIKLSPNAPMPEDLIREDRDSR
jgi:plasmid stability protein